MVERLDGSPGGFDSATHQFELEPANASVDAAGDWILLDLDRFSQSTFVGSPGAPGTGGGIWSWLFGGDDPPAPPPISVDESTECEQVCGSSVYCGQYTSSCSASVAAGSTVSISQTPQANLEATYGAQVGAALSSVSSSASVSFSTSSTGSVSGTSSIGATGSFSGGSFAAHRCLSGPTELYLVYKKYTLSAGSTELGSIRVPKAVTVKSDLSFDAGCLDCHIAVSPPADTGPCD